MGGRDGFESLEIACWPPSNGPSRRYAGTTHIDVADLSEGRASEIRAEVARRAWRSPGWASTRTRCTRTVRRAMRRSAT